MSEVINQLTPLTGNQWQTVLEKADKLSRANLHEPKLVIPQSTEFPPALVKAVIGMLILVSLAAFYLSAGKEITAVDNVLSPLIGNRITLGYVDIGIVAALLLAEVGALLFGLASRIVEQQQVVSLALRGFQGGSVGVAVLGNVTITLANPNQTHAAFDWLLTLMPPIIVIGVGLIVEQLAMTSLLTRQAALKEYKLAHSSYMDQLQHPEKRGEVYGSALFTAIIDALKNRTADNRLLIEGLERAGERLTLMDIAGDQFRRHTVQFDPSKARLGPGNVHRLPKPNNRPSKPVQKPSGQPVQSGQGSEKDVSKDGIETERLDLSKYAGLSRLEVAVQFLLDSPEYLPLSVRQLEAKTGISKATWQNAKKELQPVEESGEA